MKKVMLLSALLMSSSALAYEIDTSACAGTEFIYDSNGDFVAYDSAIHTDVTSETPVYYVGSETIPHMFLHTNRAANVIVKNVSQHNLNFSYNPSFYQQSTGALVNNWIAPRLFGVFSNSNSPSGTGGAQMSPRTAGYITEYYTSSVYMGHAAIRWDSSECMTQPPLLVSVENIIKGSGAIGHSVYLVNEGNRW